MNLHIKTALYGASFLALTGCGLFSDDPKVTPNPLVPTNITVAQCADVNDPNVDEQMRKANTDALTSMQNMASALDEGNVGDVQTQAPSKSVLTYDEILQQYPGHCGAQFGKAFASLANLVNDPEIKNAMDEVSSENTDETISYNAILNLGVEQSPTTLVKLARQVAATDDPLTVTRTQDIIASRVIPRVDTAIAMLNNVMKYDDFVFDLSFVDNGDSVYKQIDKGEVGPALATLKLIKAALIVYVSINLEVSDNGSYAYIDTLMKLRDADFDHLTPGQESALDYALSFTNKNSLLTTVRPGWADEYAAIPALLMSALDDVQNGLRYGIAESRMAFSAQQFDIYKVGEGTGFDVSPSQLEDAIEDMERIRKYLQGRVNISFSKGTQTIAVNFPRFFSITNGFQDFLPYHVVRPYAEWNDVLSADTSWYPYFEGDPDYGSGELAAKQILSELYTSSVRVDDYDYSYNGMNYAYSWNLDNGDVIHVGTATNCDLSFSVNSDAVQTIRLNDCRIENGRAMYVDYIDADILGPFYFTDAQGNATFGTNIEQELQQLVDAQGISGLKNKIVFPDPTFGGVFPNLTNNNIFEILAAFETIEPRPSCVAYEDQWGYTDYDCSNKVMPKNPSDLDVLNYYLGYK